MRMMRSGCLIILISCLACGAQDCARCPPDIDCLSGAPCALGTSALAGSARCCPLARACGALRVLDGDTCRCVPLACPAGRVLLQRGAAQRLYCSDAPPPHCAVACVAQIGFALDVAACACVPVPECAKKNETLGGGWWRAGSGEFACVAAAYPS